MQDIIRPVKKPSGCLNATGWVLTIGSLLFIILCVAMIFQGEEHMDELRAEHAASYEEYEKAMEAYHADSAHLQAEYQRIQAMIDKAEAAGDTITAMELSDSLAQYAEPEFAPRGAIGFNIGGAFFLFFALCALVPLALGIVIIIYCHNRKLKYKRYHNSF